jgi:hypothetical protein
VPEVPAVTVVEKMAPRAMNAPARTDRLNIVMKGISAFRTPSNSARRAISDGIRASILTSLLIEKTPSLKLFEKLLKTNLLHYKVNWNLTIKQVTNITRFSWESTINSGSMW